MMPDTIPPLRRFVLNTNEAAVSRYPGEIVCHGLGSCVGVFLYDKFQKVGAGAHVMLPDGRESVEMMNHIVNGMLVKDCHVLTIRARLVGGASLMNMRNYQIGQRNIEYVKKELKNRGIMILAEDTGGTKSRTAKLDIGSGILSISDPEKNFYTI